MSTLESRVDRQQIERLDALLQGVDRLGDPAARAHAREMVQALLDVHGEALSRILARLAESGEPGRSILDSLAADDLVSSLLLLYDLHPHDLETRIRAALERVRPLLRHHGGDVELLETSGGIIRLRMLGNCHGCPSSAITLKSTLENAIHEAAPDALAIEVEGAEPSPNGTSTPLVTLGPLPARTDKS